jgi:hypothetical protein
MTIAKYIGMDVHKESISIAVMNSTGKFVMECVIETKASMLLQFIDGLRGDVCITFEEGTWAAWLYDLLKPHVSEVVVCNPRKNALLKNGSKSDRIDARKLAELLRGNQLKPVYQCAVKGAGQQWVKFPPGNWFAPPGSNRSSRGGNEAAGASGVEGRSGDLASMQAVME